MTRVSGASGTLAPEYDGDIPQCRSQNCLPLPEVRSQKTPDASILCAKCVRTALYGALLEGIGQQG